MKRLLLFNSHLEALGAITNWVYTSSIHSPIKSKSPPRLFEVFKGLIPTNPSDEKAGPSKEIQPVDIIIYGIGAHKVASLCQLLQNSYLSYYDEIWICGFAGYFHKDLHKNPSNDQDYFDYQGSHFIAKSTQYLAPSSSALMKFHNEHHPVIAFDQPLVKNSYQSIQAISSPWPIYNKEKLSQAIYSTSPFLIEMESYFLASFLKSARSNYRPRLCMAKTISDVIGYQDSKTIVERIREHTFSHAQFLAQLLV